MSCDKTLLQAWPIPLNATAGRTNKLSSSGYQEITVNIIVERKNPMMPKSRINRHP
jgi:hypothetical protein